MLLSGPLRDRIALLLALAAIVGVGVALFVSKGTQLLMPGPLTSAHGAIENCSSCHTKSGEGKLSWLHGLVAGDPLADSKACLTCHKMPETAFNPHGATAGVLNQSTERLTNIAAKTPQPQSARAQSVAFPTHDIVARGLYCATCHQEHQGAGFKLNKISNEQCRSCHVVRFDSFDGDHPKFDDYPFKRRTRIIYDHAGHFGKHYPELAKKDPARRIPETCSTCHNSRDDKRVMAVAPFEQTCSACHLDQIVGKERASGPKGIAFLTVPGLDLKTLQRKNAAIGEWPEASEAEITPFMKVMISRNERGQALLKSVEGLNLQDLSNASEDQIKTVTSLAWEIKGLFYSLIKGKASDVLGDLNIGSGAKLSAGLVADLTASIPRDVVTTAQQQWLPNLATEMANGPITRDQRQSTSSPAAIKSTPAEPEASKSAPDRDAAPATAAASEQDASSEEKAPARKKLDPPPCLVRVLGECLMPKEEDAAPPAERAPGAARAGLTDIAQAETRAAAGQPQRKAAGQTDDLLSPTEEELRAIRAHNQKSGKTGQPEAASGNAGSTVDRAEPATPGRAPEISIASDVDPESWAEYGGWYRQDYAIFYRPIGHKDKFNYAWLFLTGPQAPKGSASPGTAVFDYLTRKDAQGSCTKCHSVDDIPGKGRAVNFSPPRATAKQGRFTSFIHEPHFGLMETRGCLTCHGLEKDSPYLKSFEQGNPQSFASNFGAVKKDLCQTCHNNTMARQDCLTCHKYHVNGVTTPIMSTKIPLQ